MPKVYAVNLIRVFSGKADATEVLDGVSPRAAAEKARASCAEQAQSLEVWSAGVVAHCIIPPGHPFRKLLAKRKVPPGDPLWTLGAIAYGATQPWIIIRRIRWEDGREDFPDQWEKAWSAKQSSGL